MPTAARSKSGKNGPKKRFAVENIKTGLGELVEPIGTATGGIFEEAAAAKPAGGISGDEKYQLIAEAAYFRSEKRSFAPGYELEDWLAAEAEIESRVSDIQASRGSQYHVDKRPRRR